MPTDYEKEWPSLLPQWCQDEVARQERKLLDKINPPSEARAEELERKIAVLTRIRKDYEGKQSA
jgi:hypothetical protein